VVSATAEIVTIRRFTKLGKISALNIISSIRPLARTKQPVEDEEIENQKPEILQAFAKKYGFQIASDFTQAQRYE